VLIGAKPRIVRVGISVLLLSSVLFSAEEVSSLAPQRPAPAHSPGPAPVVRAPSVSRPTPPHQAAGTLGQRAPYRPAPYNGGGAGHSPVYVRPPLWQPAPFHNEFRLESHGTLQMALEEEIEARHATQKVEQSRLRQKVLGSYIAIIGGLENERQSLRTAIDPRTYVPLARSHLDAARTMALLNQYQESRQHIDQARGLLLALAAQPMPPGWIWRVLYLLGDVNLFDNNRAIAAYYYKQAAELKPDFRPAAEMAVCVNNNADLMQTCSTSLAPFTAASVEQPLVPVAPKPPPPKEAVVAIPEPQQPPAAPPTPQEVWKSTPPQMVQDTGQALALVATFFEDLELGPAAAAIQLTGMIFQDLHERQTQP
jgi:hypothetical protein